MDWIACVFEILGSLLIGNKKKSGFLFLIMGSIFWFLTAFSSGLNGLKMVSIIFFLINIRNYIKWTKENSLKLLKR